MSYNSNKIRPVRRCEWVGEDRLYQHYHDTEWGRALYDAPRLFEALCLESQQAGLSWLTILKKRQGYREHFCNFDPQKVANFTLQDIDRIVQSSAVIRHRAKLEAIVKNARAYLLVIEKHGDFSDFIWDFVDGVQIVNFFDEIKQVPSATKQSDKMARELKKYGFSFLGATSCYAFMQAVGLVNDHLSYCDYHCSGSSRPLIL